MLKCNFWVKLLVFLLYICCPCRNIQYLCIMYIPVPVTYIYCTKQISYTVGNLVISITMSEEFPRCPEQPVQGRLRRKNKGYVMFTVLYSGSVLHCTVYLSIQIHIAHYYVHYCTYCSSIQLNEQKYIFLINIMYCSITRTAQLNVRVYILHIYGYLIMYCTLQYCTQFCLVECGTPPPSSSTPSPSLPGTSYLAQFSHIKLQHFRI